mgnify:CR=1 FL=1
MVGFEEEREGEGMKEGGRRRAEDAESRGRDDEEEEMEEMLKERNWGAWDGGDDMEERECSKERGRVMEQRGKREG